MSLFEERKMVSPDQQGVPVWLMRQAGRYHQHYQGYRKKYSFMEICKKPQIACEVTLGPFEEFGFDAAIVFSDLLFPLDYLGMGLSYDQGPPALSFHLNSLEDYSRLRPTMDAAQYFSFQGEAISLLKQKLPKGTTLLGFVGGPFTLYTYAVVGSHAGQLVAPKVGLVDGRFDRFNQILMPHLLTNMSVQAQAGADCVAILDTAAGELSLADFRDTQVPVIRELTASFKKLHPKTKVLYYSKTAPLEHFKQLKDPNIDAIGVDWRMDLPKCLRELGEQYYIQGNIDPAYAFLDWKDMKAKLEQFKTSMEAQGGQKLWNRWIFGFGHGVLPKTPEKNIKNLVDWVHSNLTHRKEG